MFAEQEFKLSEQQQDGKSLREHLLAVERMTGKLPVELANCVELPESIRECWYWFLALNNSRVSGFGMSPITYTEMSNYFNLLQIEPEPHEVEIIKLFDSVAIEISQKQQEKRSKKK